MKHIRNFLFAISTVLLLSTNILTGQHDWDDYTVPASPGPGMIWEIQEDVSDDFNYNFEATSDEVAFEGKWKNWYHNPWTGPPPTIWKRNNVSVKDGYLQIETNRQSGQTTNVNGRQLQVTNTGCVTSLQQIVYPVYIESRAKVMNSVLASATWLLSPDDTQEIDFLEAYGSDRWLNPWFNEERIHLSHHVFVREPFADWQPNDEGSFYTDGETVWREEFHTYGVYWKDPWSLEYYIDGKLVRTISGKDNIDPLHHTNSINPGNTNSDTRTGLSKPMDILIDTEDQTWRAVDGLSPTNQELLNKEDHTFKVDWIRVYKPIVGEVGSVTGVTLDKEEVSLFVGEETTLIATVQPNNALNQNVSWTTDNPDVVVVDDKGTVNAIAGGTATITVTTEEGNKSASSTITVSSEEKVAAFVSFDDESIYLDTIYSVNGEIAINCTFHAGSGNTVVEGGQGGIKFWLREIQPGWSVANDYTVSDESAIGQESGTASAIISLEGVPSTSEIPPENWYFLFILYVNSAGETVEKGIFPINIERSTNTTDLNNQEALRIHPNPSEALIFLKGNVLTNKYDFEIYNANGKIVRSIRNQRGDKTIDIHNLQSGMYFLKLTDRNNQSYLRSFVKK